MKKLLILCLAGSMLALVGCKTKVHAPINYSDIFGEQKTIPGGIAVQVPSCTDTSKKFESNSVMEAKQKIPYIFPEAKSFAHTFKVFCLRANSLYFPGGKIL